MKKSDRILVKELGLQLSDISHSLARGNSHNSKCEKYELNHMRNNLSLVNELMLTSNVTNDWWTAKKEP